MYNMSAGQMYELTENSPKKMIGKWKKTDKMLQVGKITE